MYNLKSKDMKEIYDFTARGPFNPSHKYTTVMTLVDGGVVCNAVFTEYDHGGTFKVMNFIIYHDMEYRPLTIDLSFWYAGVISKDVVGEMMRALINVYPLDKSEVTESCLLKIKKILTIMASYMRWGGKYSNNSNINDWTFPVIPEVPERSLKPMSVAKGRDIDAPEGYNAVDIEEMWDNLLAGGDVYIVTSTAMLRKINIADKIITPDVVDCFLKPMLLNFALKKQEELS